MNLIDLHEDFAYSSMYSDVIEDTEQSNIKMLKNFDNVIIFSAIFPHINVWNNRSEKLTLLYGNKTKATVPLFDVLKEQVKFYLYLESKGLVNIVRDKVNSGINFLLSLEGTDVLTDPYDLYLLKELNVLSVGITWNYDTKFGSSCMSKKDYGLTEDGEELIRIANKIGIIIDLAHSSKRTLMDAATVSNKPLIVSHANAMKLKKHPRNLDDEEIEAIVKTDGVIGITAIVETLPESSIKGIIDNINYIGESYGWRYVALGTDFLGIEKVPKGFENVVKIKDLNVDHKEIFWENAMRVIKNNLNI